MPNNEPDLPVSDSPPPAPLDVELPTVAWGREGYQAAEVDPFVERLRQAVLREPPTMAPYEVADQRFKVTRFGRRYALRSVDELLDAGQEQLRRLHGDDAVADLEGQLPQPPHLRTGWIYLTALVLVVAMLVFVLTQL